jgi:hypothetical protein
VVGQKINRKKDLAERDWVMTGGGPSRHETILGRIVGAILIDPISLHYLHRFVIKASPEVYEY